MAFIGLLKVNESVLDSCNTTWKMNSNPCWIIYNKATDICNVQQRQRKILSLSLSLSLSFSLSLSLSLSPLSLSLRLGNLGPTNNELQKLELDCQIRIAAGRKQDPNHRQRKRKEKWAQENRKFTKDRRKRKRKGEKSVQKIANERKLLTLVLILNFGYINDFKKIWHS